MDKTRGPKRADLIEAGAAKDRGTTATSKMIGKFFQYL